MNDNNDKNINLLIHNVKNGLNQKIFQNILIVFFLISIFNILNFSISNAGEYEINYPDYGIRRDSDGEKKIITVKCLEDTVFKVGEVIGDVLYQDINYEKVDYLTKYQQALGGTNISSENGMNMNYPKEEGQKNVSLIQYSIDTLRLSLMKPANDRKLIEISEDDILKASGVSERIFRIKLSNATVEVDETKPYYKLEKDEETFYVGYTPFKLYATNDKTGINATFYAFWFADNKSPEGSNLMYDLNENSYLAFYRSDLASGVDHTSSINDITTKYYEIIDNPYGRSNPDLYLNIFKYKDGTKGYGKLKDKELSKINIDVMESENHKISGDQLAIESVVINEVRVTPVLRLMRSKLTKMARIEEGKYYASYFGISEEEGIKIADSSGRVDGEVATEEGRLENENEFYAVLMSYGLPIFLFILLIALLSTGMSWIITSQNAEERVKLYQRLKVIGISVVAFATVGIIVTITRNFVLDSFETLDKAQAEYRTEIMIEENLETVGWWESLLVAIMDTINSLTKYFAMTILSHVYYVDIDSELSLSDLILPEFDDPTLDPFSPEEWTLYMYGYNSLIAIALVAIAIAFIKNSCSYLLNKGNAEAITACRQAMLRLVLSVFAIILGPYIVRLILTFFNYASKLIPYSLNSQDFFELNFENMGVIGTIADITYFWLIIKIYLVFIVRKIMLAFVLLLTPVVFGYWAISEKTRGVSLWIGELITNSALQFFYCLVFFVIRFILVNNTNSFIILLTVVALEKIVSFFREGLQGLVQKWGGIDEEGMAEQTLNKMKGWTQRTVNLAYKPVKIAGNTAVTASALFDKEGVTKAGQIANNVGSIVTGRFTNFRTNTDLAKSRLRSLSSRANQSYSEMQELDRDLTGKGTAGDGLIGQLREGSDKDEVTRLYNKISAGETLNADEVAQIETGKEIENVNEDDPDGRLKAGIYGKLSSLYGTKKKYDRQLNSALKVKKEQDTRNGLVSNKKVYDGLDERYDENIRMKEREKVGYAYYTWSQKLQEAKAQEGKNSEQIDKELIAAAKSAISQVESSNTRKLFKQKITIEIIDELTGNVSSENDMVIDLENRRTEIINEIIEENSEAKAKFDMEREALKNKNPDLAPYMENKSVEDDTFAMLFLDYNVEEREVLDNLNEELSKQNND